MVHSFPKVNVETRPGYLLSFFFFNKIVLNGIRSGEAAGNLFGLPHVAFTVQNDEN